VRAQRIVTFGYNVGTSRIDPLTIGCQRRVRRFRPIEMDCPMRAITERFSAGMPTATERILFAGLEWLALPPRQWFAVFGDHLDLADQWNASPHNVGPVFSHHDLLGSIHPSSLTHQYY
jgi:hypothetical protein